MDTFEAIVARRSTGRLVEPAPEGDDLRRILEAAAAAPDHGELRPWRFILLKGDAKDAFGEILADTYTARTEAAGEPVREGKVRKERTKLGRAPLVLVLAVRPEKDSTIPWLEQFAAGAAAAQNVLLAATALGYGSMWRTGDPTYDATVKSALGLGEDDAIVGFIYLGTPEDEPLPPNEPDLTGLVEEWQPREASSG